MAIAGRRRVAACSLAPRITPEQLMRLACRPPMVEGYMSKGELYYWYGCWERLAWDAVDPRPRVLVEADRCYVAILGLN